jgi:hypothetical protein
MHCSCAVQIQNPHNCEMPVWGQHGVPEKMLKAAPKQNAVATTGMLRTALKQYTMPVTGVVLGTP